MKKAWWFLLLIPVAVIAGQGLHRVVDIDPYNDNNAALRLAVDSVAIDTVYWDFGFTATSQDYSSLYAKVVVGDDITGEIANNEDSVWIYLYTEMMGVRTYLDSSKAAALPDTAVFKKPALDADGGILNDTIWGNVVGVHVRITTDTTDDTPFTSYFPVKLEYILK